MKLRLLDERKKGNFLKTVRGAVILEEIGSSWTVVRYKGSRPKAAFAKYLIENIGEIKKRARANKENIPSKNIVYEIYWPRGEQEKKNYIIKLPELSILKITGVEEKKIRDIEHEFYSNVYLYESLEYPVKYGFEPGQKIVPLPSCLIFSEKTGEIIFLRNSVINTPLSIIAGERVSDVIVENTIKNTAIATAMFTRLGIHHDFHFANIGVDFSSNKCDVVFFDLENFTPLESIKKKDIPDKIFSSLSSVILVLIGAGIIRNAEQVRMFKEKYLEVNEEWIREKNPSIVDAVMRETPFASTNKKISSYHALSELRFKNLVGSMAFMPKDIAARVDVALYFLWKAVRMLLTSRL